MADFTKLIEIVEPYAESFGFSGTPDRAGLTKLMDALVEMLANAESMDIETMDTVWQASRKLQACLAADGDLPSDILAEIHAKLTGKAPAPKPAEEPPATEAQPAGEAPAPETQPSEQAPEKEEDYVIPKDDLPLIEDFITEAAEHLEAAEGGMLALEENPADTDTLNLIFRSFHTIKGMAGFMNLAQIGRLTHNAENLLDLARKGALPLVGNNVDAIFKSIDMLKRMVETLREAITAGGVVPPQSGLDDLADYLRRCASADAPAEKPALSTEGASEPPVASDGEEQPETLSEPEKTPAVTSPANEPLAVNTPAKKTAAKLDEKIKVSTERLDTLVNMVGELVIAQLMVSESLRTNNHNDNELLRNTVHQGKIIRELQELSMSMRMVPISGVFQKMARMTRDLSKQANKIINLVMEGEQTELDRTIVDMLADPLVHMIRNSVDHGIETTEERKATGKPANGTITLKAQHSAGSIVIEIGDDGRGLNRNRLLEKAIERGAISPDHAPTDQEIFSTIFLPGLSTAAKITSISGRGVGMDVVRRNIEELRGRIDIASTEGEGTVFTVTLPLTLAVIDGQMVRVGTEKYIIPINNIRRSFRPKKEEISTVHGRSEMVLVRDELLPLVRLHSMFDVEPDSTNLCEGLVVIVEEDNEACCLFVDDLLDQQQVVIKGLGPLFSQTVGVSGGAIMGDGMVRLILDIPGVIKLFRN